MRQDRLSYTEIEVETLTGIKRKTLQGWRLRGIGPHWIKAGPRLVRYPTSLLDEWINSGGGHQAETK